MFNWPSITSYRSTQQEKNKQNMAAELLVELIFYPGTSEFKTWVGEQVSWQSSVVLPSAFRKLPG
jgi:hypothetical protein